MRNLEQQIATWRKSIQLPTETVEEVESHLRELIEEQIRKGAGETESFERAVAQIGAGPQLTAEFQKIESGSWWPVRTATVLGLLGLVPLLFLLVSGGAQRPSALVLGSHIFLVTAGYVTMFIIGALAACGVVQRARSMLTRRQARSLEKAYFRFGLIAALCTGIAIYLGSIWAGRHMGASWSWDGKEIGGVSILSWALLFLAARRFASIHVLNLVGLLGIIVTALGWFAPTQSRFAAYGLPDNFVLWVFIVPTVLVIALGLLPARCLSKKQHHAE